MNQMNLEKGVRAVIAVLTVSVGLFASTPNVHGTAQTRGGAPCDVNKTISNTCGDNSYQSACLYTYTRCYAVAGWRFMTCTLQPLSKNGCERDPIRCYPRDDWTTTGACTPTYSDQSTNPPGYNTGASSAVSPRASQVK